MNDNMIYIVQVNIDAVFIDEYPFLFSLQIIELDISLN